MSSIARWSYRNVATVHPFVSEEEFTGAIIYGEPYQIACTWTAGGGEQRFQNGDQVEYVSKSIIWTEDPRPKFRDQIEMPGSYGRETIRTVTHYDMSALGEPDSPDFELATG